MLDCPLILERLVETSASRIEGVQCSAASPSSSCSARRNAAPSKASHISWSLSAAAGGPTQSLPRSSAEKNPAIRPRHWEIVGGGAFRARPLLLPPPL